MTDHSDAGRRPHTLVVGVDDSPGARQALAWATAHAVQTGAEIVAVHVLTYSRQFARDLSLTGLTNWRRKLERDLAGLWTDAVRAAGVPVRPVVVEADDAASGLLATADRVHADLVVVAARGRGTLADRILGATTYQITHRARTPVVVVPAAWDGGEATTPPSLAGHVTPAR